MKRLTLVLCAVLAVASMQAQVNVADFESGVNSGWDPVSGAIDVRANEYLTGINLSRYVLYAQRSVGADNWAGVILNNYAVSGYRYLHAYMYRSNTNVPNLKVSDTNPQDMAPMNTVVANEWQDVVWDISDYETSGTEFIFFMVDRTEITEEAWMLIDEIQLSNDATPRTVVVEGTTPPIEPSDGYILVWNEDFTEEALDRAVWNVEVTNNGGGNNELQYYIENGVSLGIEPTTRKHCLILTATKEHYQGKECTSGRVNTKNKMYYTFGRIDARIKFPRTANGLWPAFWQMGNDFDQVNWPRCGETDIIELGHQNAFSRGTQDRYFNGAMHRGSAWNALTSEANSVTWPYSVEDTFHIVTMIWTPTSIDMYMDKDAHPENGAYFHSDLTTDSNPDYDKSIVFGKPNFLIANLAVGGNFPGIFNINSITALNNGPCMMYIDWIRIYQRGDGNESFVCPTASDPIEPEDPTAGVAEIQSDNVQSTKEMRDGQMLIRRGEKVYTVMGKRLQ